MKKLIRTAALIICIFFIADKSKAQTATAVKPITLQVPVATNAATTKKASMPDAAAAIASQGIEVVKPIVIATAKLPAIAADQGGRPKQ